MISLEATRELLGPLAAGKSDAELAVIREQTYAQVNQIVTLFERQEMHRQGDDTRRAQRGKR